MDIAETIYMSLLRSIRLLSELLLRLLNLSNTRVSVFPEFE